MAPKRTNRCRTPFKDNQEDDGLKDQHNERYLEVHLEGHLEIVPPYLRPLECLVRLYSRHG